MLQGVARAVVHDGESSHTVAAALSKHPNEFSGYAKMVAAGEAGGTLDMSFPHSDGRGVYAARATR